MPCVNIGPGQFFSFVILNQSIFTTGFLGPVTAGPRTQPFMLPGIRIATVSFHNMYCYLKLTVHSSFDSPLQALEPHLRLQLPLLVPLVSSALLASEFS